MPKPQLHDPEKMAAVGPVQAQYQQHVHQGGGQVSIQFHVTLDVLWVKAEQILQSGNAITPAPGEKQTAPHHVHTKSDGQYSCDSACLQ